MATDNNITKTEMASLSLDIGRLKEEIGNVFGDDEKSKGKFISEIEAFIKDPRIETKRSGVDRLEKILSSNKNLGNNTYVQMTAKKFYLTVDKIIEQHAGEVKELREDNFKNNFDKELTEKNPSLTENQLSQAREYRNLVAKDSFNKSIIDGQQNAALENNDPVFGPGKLENAWMDLKTTVNFLQKSPEEIKSIKEKYNSLKGKLDGVDLPSGSKEARSFERMMSVLNNPNADDLFSKTKKYLGWADRVDKLTGGWLNKTVTDAGVKVFEKIGNQAIQEFATNALGQMAEQGFQKGFSTVLNGILSGGVKAATTTTASGIGGAAAGGTVAAGAAGTAAATGAGAVAGGAAVAGGVAVSATGVGAIVVAAIAVLGAAKKVGNKIAEKLGISSKKFLEENFGKVGGFFIKAATMMVAVPAAIIGAITATTVGPIIIAVVVGLFVYQIFQGSLVSSLVPPKGATSTTAVIPGTASGNDITNITETSATCVYGPINVPVIGSTFRRQDVVNVAYSLVGKVHYFWAGTYYQIGADPRWGQYATDGKGLYKPRGLDCSGFVGWVYFQLTKNYLGGSTRELIAKATSGADGWSAIDLLANPSAIKVGDVVWRTGHVGIYIGKNSQGQNVYIHAGDSSGCILVNTSSYKAFTQIIRTNVKFIDD